MAISTMSKKLSLSLAFDKLEKIVQKLEAGEMDLEEAIQLYKEGLTLAGFLRKRLKKVRNEIKEIEDRGLKE
jgi:exodeoxyribonuclease VII small subunit